MNKRKFLKTLSVLSILTPISSSAFSLTTTSELEKAILRCGATAQQYNIQLDDLEYIINEFLFIKNNGDLVGNTVKTILIRLNRQEVLDKINDLFYTNTLNTLDLDANTFDNLFCLTMDYTNRDKKDKDILIELIGGVYHYNLVRAFMENYWVYDDDQKIKFK